ncbi:cytochrome P450 [Streptomyces yaizuensis]|uniref:Cytochrome P450 n=1 Tax=Streptomyces yaizuensis TaxID=2989713 RepID=A0ABQ5NX70_9ACTN|nr:cytochrome P450 [Streptomyces sp. YSPA8]GLF94967.1 cytochrome P450 [Streptomyces sp. YSPA8]
MSQCPVRHLTPELLEDPVRGYADLRDRPSLTPVVLPGLTTPVRLVTRYADVKEALTEPRLIRDRGRIPGTEGVTDHQDELTDAFSDLPPEYIAFVNDHLALLDAEEHTSRRAPLTRAFTARWVTALRPFLEERTAQLADDLAAQGEADFLHDFAYPLATSLICELVGVDAADRDQVCGWIRDFAYGDGTGVGAALEGIVGHLKDLIARRRAEGRDDLISTLIRSTDENGSPLTEERLVSTVLLLINTGITPPALFLAHAVLALFDHPDQLDLLRGRPDLLEGAVAELLRYVSLVRIGATLYATEDFTFAGTELVRGEAVAVALLGANHDPHEYGEGPEHLDISRRFGRGDGHLAFGHGPHYCIGAALGRMLTRTVFERMLIGRPGLRPAVPRDALEFGHWPGDGFHLKSLPVRF